MNNLLIIKKRKNHLSLSSSLHKTIVLEGDAHPKCCSLGDLFLQQKLISILMSSWSQPVVRCQGFTSWFTHTIIKCHYTSLPSKIEIMLIFPRRVYLCALTLQHLTELGFLPGYFSNLFEFFGSGSAKLVKNSSRHSWL